MFKRIERIFQIHVFIGNKIVKEVFLFFQFQSFFTILNCSSRVSKI